MMARMIGKDEGKLVYRAFLELYWKEYRTKDNYDLKKIIRNVSNDSSNKSVAQQMICGGLMKWYVKCVS